MNVQGNPISAASGAASVQKPSMARVRIMYGSCADHLRIISAGAASLRLRSRSLGFALQPCRPVRPLLRRNVLHVFEVVGSFFAAPDFPLQLALTTAPGT